MKKKRKDKLFKIIIIIAGIALILTTFLPFISYLL
jgi:hypothetical protein